MSSSRGAKRKARSSSSSAAEPLDQDSLDDYNCAICMEVADDAVELPGCNHAFCRECISTHLAKSDEATCPVCRQPPKGKPRAARDLAGRRKLSVKCACGDVVALLSFRRHTEGCDAHTNQPPLTSPQIPPLGGRAPPPPGPNRSTFKCPFCQEGHPLRSLTTNPNPHPMPREDLLEHLRSVHGELAMSPAVCPVCAAMPWGSASYTTPNLLQHFQLRHRFDYDTTTDFGQDEDAVLQEVLRRSMEQQ